MPADSIKVSVLGTEKEVPINVREYYSILDDNKNYVDVYCIANTEIIKLGNSGNEVSRTITNDSYESFRVQRVSLQDLD